MCYERKLQPNMDDVVFFWGEEEEEEVDVAEKKYTAKKEKALNEEKRLVVKLGLLYPQPTMSLLQKALCTNRDKMAHQRGFEEKKEPLSYSNVGFFRLNIG